QLYGVGRIFIERKLPLGRGEHRDCPRLSDSKCALHVARDEVALQAERTRRKLVYDGEQSCMNGAQPLGHRFARTGANGSGCYIMEIARCAFYDSESGNRAPGVDPEHPHLPPPPTPPTRRLKSRGGDMSHLLIADIKVGRHALDIVVVFQFFDQFEHMLSSMA